MRVPHLSTSELRLAADKVLARHQPDKLPPIDIEAIVEIGLVPTEALRASWDETVRLALENKIDLHVLKETALDRVADRIAREFNVSEAVVTRRLHDENLFGS